MNNPRQEYPRPQLVRPIWQNLNGTWNFEMDPGKSGRARGLPEAEHLRQEILVPFCPESKLSGIGCTDFMPCVWYLRTITVEQDWLLNHRRTLLHFGACDYRTEVWLNGHAVGSHSGGFVSFSFDLTDWLVPGENRIIVCAEDDLRSRQQPSGKQSRSYNSYGCYYTRTTGIWQTVWLENLPDAAIVTTRYTPLLAEQSLLIEAVCANAHGMTCKAEAFFAGRTVGSAEAVVSGKKAVLCLRLHELQLWAPGQANLYDLRLTLGEDSVESYFGMRDIVYQQGKLLLNGQVLFQRLVLDQGFYPDGIYTAADDEELKRDILLSQAMGFQGARLHQKVFEPRFLYHCDRLGYLVWGEYGDWGLDLAQAEAWQSFLPEWLQILERDYNHPALVGWCPCNETQEDQNQALVHMAVALTHAYDQTRPVIDTSGWTHVRGLSDLVDTHDYEQNPAVFQARYDKLMLGETVAMVNGEPDRPTFMSEYGGIWWCPAAADGWGYGERPRSEEEFLDRFSRLTRAILQNPNFCALCYTQLTDVEQEKNGLYTDRRHPKFDPQRIAAVLQEKAAIES